MKLREFIQKSMEDYERYLRMKEFLILGNSRELKHIDSADICYISADGNCSNIFLTNGKKIQVTMQLGQVKSAIDECLPLYHSDFYRVGQSLIINKIYLFSINLTSSQVVLSVRHSDRNLDSSSEGVVLSASKDSLKILKEEIEKKKLKRRNNERE